MIQDYTIIPDFKKMGFEILALTFVKISAELLTPEVRRSGEEYAANWHNALFVSVGEGLGMNIVAMTIHRDYTEFHRQLNQVRLDWKDHFGDIQSFIIPFGEEEFKRLSFAYLGDISLQVIPFGLYIEIAVLLAVAAMTVDYVNKRKRHTEIVS